MGKQMIADTVSKIQSNPDWIFYGIMVLAGLVSLAVGLLVWRRADRLLLAENTIVDLHVQIEELQKDATLRGQQMVDLREEVVRFSALQGAWSDDHTDLVSLRHNLSERMSEVAGLKATIAHQRETDGTLKAQFSALASEVMQAQTTSFNKVNQEQIGQVLQPLKEHIGRFETELRNVHEAAGKDRAALKNEILSLTNKSMQVSEEAHNLTKALKGDTQKQGAWGEMILASILDRSGLREGFEYDTQSHHRTEEGAALRPDVVVNLPGGRKLVIDSKVSLVAYERSVNAENEEASGLAMHAHVASVKTHIDTLSAKKYHQLDDGAVDYVIMFMPIESAFSEAVKARNDLALYATEKNVLIASPTNLMLVLKTAENLWSVEKRNKNALEIAKRAGRLYDKFHDFVADMQKIGTQLNATQKTHDAAMGKLTAGRGNLIGQAQTLKKLGARAAKEIEIEHDEEEEPHLIK